MLKGTLPILINHRRLASDNARLEGSIPLSRFTRFIEMLVDDSGEVAAKVDFRKGHKRKTLVVGAVEATVKVVCQNCMTPANVDISATVRLLIVGSDDELAALAENDDGMVCVEEQVLLVDLLEDELILAMPMVGRHADGLCTPGPALLAAQMAPVKTAGAEAEKAIINKDTYKAFAGLGALTDGMFDKKDS
jgi:uncharacterized protein